MINFERNLKNIEVKMTKKSESNQMENNVMNKALKKRIDQKIEEANVTIQKANKLDGKSQIKMLEKAYSGVSAVVPSDLSFQKKKEIWSYISDNIEEIDFSRE